MNREGEYRIGEVNKMDMGWEGRIVYRQHLTCVFDASTQKQQKVTRSGRK